MTLVSACALIDGKAGIVGNAEVFGIGVDDILEGLFLVQIFSGKFFLDENCENRVRGLLEKIRSI